MSNLTTTTSGIVSKCDLFNNENACDVVITVKRAAASVSLVGCLLMLLIIFIYRRHSTFVQRIILYMTLSTLLSAIAYIMGDTQPAGPLCTFQGFLTNLTDWLVLLWMFMITLTLYLAIVKEKRIDRFEWMFHILCWGVPIAISCLPFIGNHFGPAGPWCWVEDTYWRFGIWFIPLFLVLAVMITLYAHLVYYVHKKVQNFSGSYSYDNEQSQRMMLEEIRQLRAYPFIYLVLNVFPLANRIQNAVNSQHQIFWLTLLHVLSTSLLGAVNAVVFGLNKQTMNDLKWKNFKVQVRNRLTNRQTVIAEYEPQEDDMEVTRTINADY